MKRLFCMMLASVAMFTMTACNKDLGPEYTTPPVIKSVMINPITPSEGEPVTVSAKVTSQYGLSFIGVMYQVEKEGEKVKQLKPTTYGGAKDTSVDYVCAESIPGFPKGTKVVYQVVAQSPYGPLAASSPLECFYVVGETGIKPLPPTPVDPVQ